MTVVAPIAFLAGCREGLDKENGTEVLLLISGRSILALLLR